MKIRHVDAFTLTLLSVSILMNVFLAARVHRLIAELTPPPPDVVAAGVKVATVEAKGLDGKKVSIGFSDADRPAVLYVFSPSCKWCAKNYNNLTKLYAMKQNDYRFVGISLASEDLPEYVTAKKFPLRVIQQVSSQNIRNLHLNETPETIVVDRTGTVTKAWAGAYTAKMCREIEAYFGLPPYSLSAASAAS